MRIHTYGEENGQVMIMLPGSFCNADTMANIIEKQKEEFRVLAVDYNGQYAGSSRAFTSRAGEAEEIVRYLQEQSISSSGHRKYPLGSHDPEVRKTSLEIMEKAIEFAYKLGVRIIQLAGYDVYYEEGDEESRAFFLENLKKATEYAASREVIMGFETMETPFMDTVKKSMAYVNEVESPYLGVYPDVGNLSNASILYGTDILEDIRAGKGHIFAAHLKATKPGLYRDMYFGDPDTCTPFVPCIKELYMQGVRVFTGEFWNLPGEDYKIRVPQASTFLRSKIEEAVESILGEEK